MADYTIHITFAGRDDVSDDVQKVQRSIQNLNTTSDAGTRKMRNFSNEQKEAGRSIGLMERAANYARPAVMSFVGAFAAERVLQFAGELNQAGMEARATTNIYRELIANTDGFTASVEDMTQRLRNATRNIVDDTTLQQGANQLIQMGLAENEEEVQRLLGMAVDLRRAGQDAGEAINDFSLLLANQSIQRLDNFGISSGRVRQQIEELIESGRALNREEAFKMAVLEEGQGAIERLGSSLDENATAWDRLSVRVQNAVSEISVHVSTAFDNAAISIESFFGFIDLINTYGADSVADAFAEIYVPGYEREIGVNTIVRNGFARQVAESDAIQSVVSERQAELEARGMEAWGRSLEYIEDRYHSIVNLAGQYYRGIEENLQQFHHWNDNLREVGEAQQAIYVSHQQLRFRELADGTQIVDPAAAQEFLTLYEDLSQEIGDLEAIKDAGGFIDEEALERVTRYRDAMSDVKDQAIEAADNFERMKLSQLFGQTDGGRSGEFWDMILQDIESFGDEDLYQQAVDASNMATGRETEASKAFENEFSDVIAKIAREQGIAAAIEAETRTREAYEEGLLEGLSQTQAVEVGRQALGYQLSGGTGGEFTINPGDTPGQIAAQYGITVDDVIAATGASSAYAVQPGTYNLPGAGELVPLEDLQIGLDTTEDMVTNFGLMAETDMAPLTTSFEGVEERADSIVDKVSSMSDMVIEPTFRPKFDLSLIPAALRDLFELMVSDNGGVVPGEDPRRRAVNGR